ncbi:hypothetical protein LX32DRAFT_256657 [Colletotrichum zoysiae]|uniref:Uncharacterized protein n=1 Tax=Colletotrichum zoysiae TaxID=1216348 RepID=A0AAD9HMM4_9PEZI|nr:hypothetical protein LX32DRAFT_256657 [Colletotrichum zoysiae]
MQMMGYRAAGIWEHIPLATLGRLRATQWTSHVDEKRRRRRQSAAHKTHSRCSPIQSNYCVITPPPPRQGRRTA